MYLPRSKLVGDSGPSDGVSADDHRNQRRYAVAVKVPVLIPEGSCDPGCLLTLANLESLGPVLAAEGDVQVRVEPFDLEGHDEIGVVGLFRLDVCAQIEAGGRFRW